MKIIQLIADTIPTAEHLYYVKSMVYKPSQLPNPLAKLTIFISASLISSGVVISSLLRTLVSKFRHSMFKQASFANLSSQM